MVKLKPFQLLGISEGTDIRTYSDNISNALTAIGNNTDTLLIPKGSTVNVTSNTIIPQNVAVIIGAGGKFNISGGYTLTINGTLDAGLYQIFEGDGSVAFGNASVTEVFPQWWGAIPGDDGYATTNVVAFQKAIDSNQTVTVPQANYYLDGYLNLNNQRQIFQGTAVNSQLTWQTDGYCLIVGGDAARGMITVSNIYFQSDTGYWPASFIRNENATKTLIQNCYFDNARAEKFIETLNGWLKIDRMVCQSSVIRQHGIHVINRGAIWSTICQIDNVEFHGITNDGYAVTIEGGARHSIQNSDFEACTNGAINLNGTTSSYSTQITNCYFEQNSFDVRVMDLAATRALGVIIEKCYSLGGTIEILGNPIVALRNLYSATTWNFNYINTNGASVTIDTCFGYKIHRSNSNDFATEIDAYGVYADLNINRGRINSYYTEVFGDGYQKIRTLTDTPGCMFIQCMSVRKDPYRELIVGSYIVRYCNTDDEGLIVDWTFLGGAPNGSSDVWDFDTFTDGSSQHVIRVKGTTRWNSYAVYILKTTPEYVL